MAAAPELPAVVEVGPHPYAVTAEELAWLRVFAETAAEGLVGQTDHNLLTITIDPKLAPAMARDTLLHEVLHAVFSAVGVSRDLGASKEEDAVNRIAPALLDVLRRNPPLVAYLLAP